MSLGLTKESMIYYTMPIGDISNGLKLVDSDKAVLEMFKCYDEFGVFLLYVVSPEMIDAEALNELTEDGCLHGEQLKENINNAKRQVQKNITEDEAQKDVDGQGKQVKQNANVVGDSEKGISEPHDENGISEPHDGNVSGGVEENKAHVEEDVEDGSESDSLFDEWSNFGDSDEDSINDSDFCINTRNVEEEDGTHGTGQGCSTTSEPKHAGDNEKGAKNVEDNDQSSEYQPSEDLDSMSSSDEDGPSWPKYPVYNKRDLERTELKLGMKFALASKFRTVLRHHVISSGYGFNFVKNDGDRVTVKCKKDTIAQKRCEWRVHASWNEYEECF
uniref:Transposase MuDR plant domain-containing protein n=1 Tax=Ananas comosus var. bracteatus TaxID=296719 RepID=A0A6V7NSV2_ANACO|nr:unnamed protein product [Ananas comosus var. bracteatus]